jgi:hypothetical protein
VILSSKSHVVCMGLDCIKGDYQNQLNTCYVERGNWFC